MTNNARRLNLVRVSSAATRSAKQGASGLKALAMAPSKGKEEKAKLSVKDALDSMESGTVQGRAEGVSKLLKILKSHHISFQLEDLEEEAYHKICETLFKVAFEEKRTYVSNKAITTKAKAEAVLTSCANALRTTIKAGAKKLKAKTRRAIIEHVTQLVPITSDEYCTLWGQIYLKVLGALFEHKPYMEQIHEDDWVTAVQFCLQGIQRHGANSGEKVSISTRNAMLVGTNSSSRDSGPRLSIRPGSDHSSGSMTRINAEELMQSLLLLLSPPNAPVLEQAEKIMEGIIHFLQYYGSTVTSIHQVSFAALNFMISAASTDEISLTESIAVRVVPIICRLWSSKTASQSLMLSSARDEMLITILSLRLHMQRLLGSTRDDFEHLLEELDSVLRNDYAKLLERDQLQLDDLDMALFSRLAPDLTFLNVGDVQLRQHNPRAERKWAVLEVLCMLEGMLHFNRKSSITTSQNVDDTCDSAHPRKRRRVTQQFEELLNRIDSVDAGEKLLALQTMLFILPTSRLAEQDVNDLLEHLTPCITDKRSSIGSWAMLCIACCASGSSNIANKVVWKRLWHTVARLITSPATCRAACHLLHSALANELVSYQDVAEDVNAIITVTEISAPALLCDTSVLLMIHLLHVRNMQVPGGSSPACQQVVRWLSARWNPVEKYFAARCAVDVHPIDIINLLRVCLDLPLLQLPSNRSNTYGIIGQAWVQLSRRDESDRYVLLLSDCVRKPLKCHECDTKTSGLHKSTGLPEKLSYSQPIRRLIIELFLPRFELLVQDWESHNPEQPAQVSTDTLRCAASTCVIGCLMLSLLTDPFLPLLQEIRTIVQRLTNFITETMNDKGHDESLVEAVLIALEPYLPSSDSSEQSSLTLENQDLYQFFVAISEKLEKSSLREVSYAEGGDLMDLDDMFEDMQDTRFRIETSRTSIPRRDSAMSMSIGAFCSATIAKLVLLSRMPQQLDGTVDDGISKFIGYFVGLSPFESLFCRRMIQDIFEAGLTIDIVDASALLDYVGRLLTPQYDCCEVALGLCLDILTGLMPIWILGEEVEVSEKAFDLYKWFIRVVIPKRRPSVNVQLGISELLCKLMGMQRSYGEEQGLPSVRSSILDLLQRGSLQVKFHIGKKIPNLFGLFVLQAHNDILDDVLESLPLDPNWIEGNAFRLHILSRLASRWHTLLRRCVYYILEVSGTIPESCGHASRCLAEISAALHLGNAQDLFDLFSSQLLFTWLESKAMEKLPFQVFGYNNLQDLLQKNKNEVVGLMIMRNQDGQLSELAKILSVSEEQLLEDSFTKIMAYSISYDISIPRSDDKYITGEARLRKRLGKEKFFQLVNTHFADIIALFFCHVDQEEQIEKSFLKNSKLLYAANILGEIKSFSALDSLLPPDQQPAFKAKYLASQITHLCGRTEFELSTLYSPAIVVCISRKLLNSVKPALGSSHTCSVLRKLRILVALAGPTALQGYPLEMLIQSLRPFIIDAACADDAIGITQYLLAGGTVHLTESPSFVAGFALSMLSSLKVFLESSPVGTTQESQFRSTLSKAQKFHAWLGSYLAKYKSPILNEESTTLFRTIVQAAYDVRSIGNAEVETPESRLLLAILDDEKSSTHLLNKPSRELAFDLLYGTFERPESFRTDILGTDHQSISYAMTLWKFCQSGRSHTQFFVWAATVLGRAFAATGNIHQDLLRESDLRTTMELASWSSKSTSKASILRLIQLETLHEDRGRAGRAETALRVIISKVNDSDAAACEDGLSSTMLTASVWTPYHVPPSDFLSSQNVTVDDPYGPHAFTNKSWLRNLTISLVRSVPSDVILFSLQPLLLNAERFAGEAFPFILHLILLSQFDGPQLARRQISKSLQSWLANEEIAARNNLKLMVNALLYLRTQPLPRESSAADRLYWLDVDYSQAAEASVRCSMFKTALLFTEISISEVSRSSRRTSASNTDNSSHVLLNIFQNVDDPDIFYGLNQVHSLKTVLSRLEYENDGSKSLAFRGAQYDSHLRLQGNSSTMDLQALVKSLGTLKLDGLSYSSLQFQQSRGMDSDSTSSMYHVARKLEQWDLPVPSASDIDWVRIYKTFREVNGAVTRSSMTSAVEDGLSSTMSTLLCGRPHANAIRAALQSLAVFVEMDEVLGGTTSEHFEEMLPRFNNRSDWMRTGKWEDVGEILSCRETLLSCLSQKAPLRDIINVNASDARLVEVQTTLLSAKLTRAHGALQESLQSATHLSSLVEPCLRLGLNIEAAAHIEAASALWDQGEMASSIGILKSLEHSSTMKKQTVTIAKSDLLAKIAFQISEARLEKPDRIIEKYLVPALKELKGKAKGGEAGKVFHEFAVFCDRQFQDPNGLEDLERLRRLKEMKESEVRDLAKMTKTAATPDLKSRYHSHFIKAKQWLQLDSEEYRRLSSGRDELLRQSLENYLLSLVASDEYNNDALRFSALWLEHAEEEIANDSVAKHLNSVPSRKFASLTNQLTSRLLDSSIHFQELLFSLVLRVCTDHPYHGMYQIWAGTKNKVSSKDEAAVSRNAATAKVASHLEHSPKSSKVWKAISNVSRVYCQFAAERDETRFKAGQKIALKDSVAGSILNNMLPKFPVPPPTMHVEIASDLDYSNLPVMYKLVPQISIASGVSAPKIITVIADNGAKHKQLVKGGSDDLRQDAIMEQVFSQVSQLLRANTATRQRNLGIRTYKVLPLSSNAGIIEFVANTIPLHEYLMPAHERYYPKDLKGSACRKQISDVQTQKLEVRIKTYRQVTDQFHPVMRYFLLEKFHDPDDWFTRRVAYTRSTAAISMLGHVLGLGDRHGHNILLDEMTGEVVHIDLGVAFETGRVLPVPELVPFRLTRDIQDGMGTTKTEGIYRRCCEFTLDALRKEAYSIMTILDVLRYDPLYNWSISPVRLAKLQDAQSAAPPMSTAGDTANGKTREAINEPSEADRALTVVRKKLSKTLSVTATVNDLINQASDERNLAVLYAGWAAYA